MAIDDLILGGLRLSLKPRSALELAVLVNVVPIFVPGDRARTH